MSLPALCTLCITDHVALKSLVGAKAHSSSRQARYALDLQECDLEIIHRAGARHHIADIISRTPATMMAATAVTLTEDMKHYYDMVHEVNMVGVVPTNPEAFEQMLNQDIDLVGTQSCKYQDSKMFGDTIGQQSLSNALSHASIPTEATASLPPGIKTAQALLTQLHGDTFRQQAAWKKTKPIDPDPSRTLEIWETICELDEVYDTYTIDSDSDYESDGENVNVNSENIWVSAPID